MQDKPNWDAYAFFLGQINSMDTKASSLLTLYTLVTSAYLGLIAGFGLFKHPLAVGMVPGMLCLLTAVLMCARVTWTGDQWSSSLVRSHDLSPVIRIRDVKTWFLSRSIIIYAVGLLLATTFLVVAMLFPLVPSPPPISNS